MPDADAGLLGRVRPLLGGARFAFVFGSYGTPAFGDESDLDLAVGFGRRLEPRERFELARAMVGFRNVAVHDYAALDPEVVHGIVRDRLGDLERLAAGLLSRLAPSRS